ncbi:MAG: DUF3817 domain-containing protein [Actinobacteria bacterium]|nr:DUF3817 domain-containing protein [Actinomycetota bacterium]
MASLKTFRIIALAEATSFLILLAGSAIKASGGTEAIVQILGPLHGVLFMAYAAIAITGRDDYGLTGKQLAWVLVGAVLPFGGYVVDRWFAKRETAGAQA